MSITPTKAKSEGPSGKYRTYQRGETTTAKTGSIGGVSTGGTGGGTPQAAPTSPQIKAAIATPGTTSYNIPGAKVAVTPPPTPPQQAKVYVDKASVDQYNEAMRQANIKNASDYFQAIREQQKPKEAPEPTRLPRIPVAPRVPNRSETINVNPPIEPSPYTGPYSITEYPDYNLPKPQKPWYATFEGQKQMIEAPINKIQNALTNPYEPSNAAVILLEGIKGAAKVPIDTAEGLYRIGEQVTKKQIKPYEVPGVFIEGVATGTGEAIGKAIEETGVFFRTGEAKGLAGQAGELYAGSVLVEGASEVIGKAAGIIRNRPGTPTAKFNEAVYNPPKAPVENPTFKRPFAELNIRDANPKIKAPENFYYIPTEYTELGKNFETAPDISLDASYGEVLPGTYLKGSQPIGQGEKMFYKNYPNIPPELQTRLSALEPPPFGLPQRTPGEILDLQKGSEQTKISSESKNPRGDYFESKAYKDKLLQEELDKAAGKDITQKSSDAKSKVYFAEPLTATLLTVSELVEQSKVSEILQAKYKAYKKTINLIGEREVVTTSQTLQKPPAILRIDKDIALRNAPPITSVHLRDEQNTAALPRAEISIRSEIKTKPDVSTQTGGRTKPSVITIPQAATTQEVTQIPLIIQAPEIVTRITPRQITQPEVEEPTFFPPFKAPEPPEEIKVKPGRFEVQVKKRGIFQFTSKPKATLKEAQREAEHILENTEAASYRIVENGRVQNIIPGIGFARSKRLSNVVIEPRSKRISTPGEKTAITFAPKNRRGKRRGVF